MYFLISLVLNILHATNVVKITAAASAFRVRLWLTINIFHVNLRQGLVTLGNELFGFFWAQCYQKKSS